jgi:hypothetical protein
MSGEIGRTTDQADGPSSNPQGEVDQPPGAAPLGSTTFGEGTAPGDPAGGTPHTTSTAATDTPGASLKRPTPATRTPAAKSGGRRIGELIWLSLGVVDAFLALDFLFRALAESDSGFVAVVSRVGNALASPFNGILSGHNVPHVDHTTFWAALLALVVYTVAAWILLRLLRVLTGSGRRHIARA